MRSGGKLGGRYDTVRQLGSGAAGELVLVRDNAQEGQHCALKILRPRLRDPGLVPLFRSEFLLLAEIKHPWIVSVRDFGVLEGGEPYFTMDFVPGEHCRAFVRDDRLEPGDYLDLASHMLDALAHIHARGILHRDIKPENIILRRGDGRLEPVLIDFGLAVIAGAQRTGEATGTLPYIAPEVLAGQTADGRADLFSLGMVLYEVATGRPVSERQELLREPGRILAPDRVRRMMRRTSRGTVPRRFEDFVSRLLAPARANRYPSATAALRDLAEIYGEDFEVDVEVAARPTLGEAPLVGRKGALDALMQRVDALCDSGLLQSVAVVAGAPGMGATRLLTTLRNHAAVSGCMVCSGASLRELALDVLAHPSVAEDVARLGDSPSEHVFRIDAALHKLSQNEHPVLLLDDVHALREDEAEALRDWVAALERRGGRARQLLVLGGRNEGDGPGVEILKTAGGAVPVDLRDLAPLKAADVRAALATLLGVARVPADVVSALQRASDGNPRLLGELLELLVDEGVLDLSEGRPVLQAELLQDVRLPRSVAETTQRRAKRLPAAARDLVARFALIEEPLPFEAARALAAADLEIVLRERFLIPDRGRLRFASELTRRGADMLKGEGRRKALCETAGTIAPFAPSAAAALFAEAGELDSAREVGLPAARKLRGDGRLESARRLLRRLAGIDPDAATGQLLLDVCYESGRWAEAADLGRRLLGDASDHDLVLQTVSAMRTLGKYDDALELLRRIDRETEGEIAVRVTNAKAALLLSAGRPEEALLESGRAEAAGGGLLDPGARVARTRAAILRAMGNATAARSVESAIVAAGEDVNARARLGALTNRAIANRSRGRIRAALRDLRAALHLARDTGQLAAAGRLLFNLANLLADLGRPGRAVRLLERARELFRRTGREEEMARVLSMQAHALLLAGRPTEAEARLARAENLPGYERLATAKPEVELTRTHVAFLSGRTRQAVAGCEALMQKPGAGKAAEALARASFLMGGGDPAAAEAAWRRALKSVWDARLGAEIPRVRIGLAQCAGARGAWHLAEKLLGAGESASLSWSTPVRAQALLVRAAAALHRGEPARAGRLLEEAVAVANRCDDAPLRAEAYAAAASLLEEGEMQRYLREPTAAASAALLEAARDIWLVYGNEPMLRKIDLHLSELPRPAGDALGGPEADRLVKVLHVTRELNREFDRDRLLGLILDRAVELTGAERGFVILLREGREDIHLARNLDRESVSEPERKLSSNIIKEVVRTGRIVRSEDAEDDDRFEDFLSVRQLHLKSIIGVPFRSSGKTIGALYLDNRFRTANFTEQDERLLELFADQAVAAIDKAELIRELEAKGSELEGLYRQQKAELKKRGRELSVARQEVKQHRRARGWGFDKITARSVAMQAVVREAKRVADTELAVLLTGENGTGKEMMARAIHCGGKRQEMPFVAVNCAAFPEGLLEAELFGHVRGSFTGADRDRPGLFEEANAGTIFLDEIGDMALAMQVKLLRALEQGEVRRVGETQVRTVDVRVIAATNADLEQLIRHGKFREDVYYRLAGYALRIPPLRERLEDVEPLAYAFVEEAARREGRSGLSISNEAIARLESFSWSGNVRELRNVILRAVVTAEGDAIRPEDIKFDTRSVTVLPGFDPAQADRILDELVNQGLDLNARQQTAVNRVLTRGKLSFGEYQQLFRVSKSTTARDLEYLVGEGLLEKRGKTRAVVYLPGARLQEIARKVGGV